MGECCIVSTVKRVDRSVIICGCFMVKIARNRVKTKGIMRKKRDYQVFQQDNELCTYLWLCVRVCTRVHTLVCGCICKSMVYLCLYAQLSLILNLHFCIKKIRFHFKRSFGGIYFLFWSFYLVFHSSVFRNVFEYPPPSPLPHTHSNWCFKFTHQELCPRLAFHLLKIIHTNNFKFVHSFKNFMAGKVFFNNFAKYSKKKPIIFPIIEKEQLFKVTLSV